MEIRSRDIERNRICNKNYPRLFSYCELLLLSRIHCWSSSSSSPTFHIFFHINVFVVNIIIILVDYLLLAIIVDIAVAVAIDIVIAIWYTKDILYFLFLWFIVGMFAK